MKENIVYVYMGNRKKKPFPIEKIYIRRRKCYTVRSKKKDQSGKSLKVYSKCTSKTKAKKQMRLLAALIYNPKFRKSFKNKKKIKK